MPLQCRFVQNAIARSAVSGAELAPRAARHVDRCQSCMKYAADMATLSRDLGAAIPSVTPDAAEVDRAMAAIARSLAPRPAGPRSPRLSWSVMGACAVMLLVVALWPRHTPTVEGAVPETVARPGAERPRLDDVPPTQLRPGPDRRLTAAPEATAPPQTARHHVRIGARSARRVDAPQRPRIARGSRTTSRGASAGVAPITSSDWIALGRYWAATADPWRASVAYGMAIESSPTFVPDLAIEAGAAAESGGDVARALTYYIEAIERSQDQNAPDLKGTMRWYEPGRSWRLASRS